MADNPFSADPVVSKFIEHLANLTEAKEAFEETYKAAIKPGLKALKAAAKKHGLLLGWAMAGPGKDHYGGRYWKLSVQPPPGKGEKPKPIPIVRVFLGWWSYEHDGRDQARIALSVEEYVNDALVDDLDARLRAVCSGYREGGVGKPFLYESRPLATSTEDPIAPMLPVIKAVVEATAQVGASALEAA
ncbi:hypothetical protein OAX78_01490 [Planctomycetota bacterium]|nr:hypothetical protein [Planctomycetota bacterium]